jgi:hypothetical protein
MTKATKPTGLVAFCPFNAAASVMHEQRQQNNDRQRDAQQPQ